MENATETPPDVMSLERVVDVIEKQSERMKRAVKAVDATEGKDPELIHLLVDRVVDAICELGTVTDVVSDDRCPELGGISDTIVGENLYAPAWETLPLLLLALRSVREVPDFPMPNDRGAAWKFCTFQVEYVCTQGLDMWIRHVGQKYLSPA